MKDQSIAEEEMTDEIMVLLIMNGEHDNLHTFLNRLRYITGASLS